MSTDPRGLLPAAETTKEERYQRVASAVVDILLARGPASVTVSAVARRAKVSRPWVYKYFGGDTDSMLAFAASSYGGVFTETLLDAPADDPAVWRESLRAGTLQGLADVRESPWVVALYYRFRYDRGVLGEAVRRVEEAHVAQVLAGMPLRLRRREKRSTRFAASFTKARLGLYFGCLDPMFGKLGKPEELVEDLMGMVDGFVSGKI